MKGSSSSSSSNKKANPSSRDVISDLPNEVIGQILSFLPPKEAALTSVLSKRWSTLFLWSPVLDFDDSLLLPKRTSTRQHTTFNNLVDKSLSLRADNASPLKRVSLKCRRGDFNSHKRMIKWIQTVTRLVVMDLDLNCNFRESRLPFSFFTNRTLVSLRIGTRVYLLESPPVSPVLASLVLDLVALQDPKAGFETVQSAFTSLQRLEIQEAEKWICWNGFITSQRLKKLVIKSDRCYTFESLPCASFNTPSLVYLDYSDVFADKYETLHLESLYEARLDLRAKTVKMGAYVSTFFMRIKHVRILCLSPNTLDALCFWCDTMPVFDNLICLSLGYDRSPTKSFVFWKLLPSLLLNSPNLETLIIKRLDLCDGKVWKSMDDHISSWDDVNVALSSSALKVLEIIGYNGTPQELKRMKRFLGNLPSLEMVKIDHRALDDRERSRLLQDLLALPLASKCKISISACLRK